MNHHKPETAKINIMYSLYRFVIGDDRIIRLT